MSKYSVKSVKSFMGREGHGCNASLYRDGKKVALVGDMADGGEIDVDWMDCKAPRVKIEFVDYMGKTSVRRGTPEEAELYKHIRHMLYVCSITGKTVSAGIDTFIASLVDAYENEKRLKKLCKKKTLFRIKSETYKSGEWRVISAPYDERVKKHLTDKYGSDLGEVKNEKVA